MKLVVTSRDIRQKYIEFFVKKGHKEIAPVPLVLEDDSTTLFTSSGMQPLVPYLKGQSHPEGTKLVDSQPCLRLEDIDEVGDSRHTTFFEMLGNWSLGEYFKKEQLSYFWEFLTEELKLEREKLYVSVFEGGSGVGKDEETVKIWKSLEVPEDHIYFYGVKKNWWSRTGTPDKMPPGEIGGPDSEVFYEFTQVKHDPKYGEKCHPNCDCGRFMEIGNCVFIQYVKKEEGTLEELAQKNVDFGGGLERITAAVGDQPDVFGVDLFEGLIKQIETDTDREYAGENKQTMRIIADHMRASTFLIINGVIPSNKMQGYVLRRLLRRSAVKIQKLNPDKIVKVLVETSKKVLENYDGMFGVEKEKQVGLVGEVITTEIERFGKTLDKGLKEVQKIDKINGKAAFDLYQTFGFPLELTEELFREKGQEIKREEFYKEFEKHKELSRTAGIGVFKGGLIADTPKTRKLHTTAHLLQASLRQILGEHVQQKGQNITEERLRFDFSHNSPLSKEEIEKVEKLINEKIEEDLSVSYKTVTLDEAIKEGALGFFKEKYRDTVTVYTIGDPSTRQTRGSLFSREICGGPHVEHTGEIGSVTITKEESAGAGIRRIYIKLL
ncbi:MAG TPA: alanine--tRNA ligase [Candidatus Blackburnbacteria bacterium]|nr:alanine--tRNA ligase [Candidatus Blackburnbacteria bacterium]